MIFGTAYLFIILILS